MWCRRKAGAQVKGTGTIYAFAADIIFVFLRQAVSKTTARRRRNRGSRLLRGRQGLPVHLNRQGCLLSPCPHCPQAHRSTPSHISHAALSPFSKCPTQPSSSSSSSPSRQEKQPLLPMVSSGRTAQHRGEHKLKESPSKSSLHPASRKVSFATPQIKDMGAKPMPHLISAEKPRGFKTFLHLKM